MIVVSCTVCHDENEINKFLLKEVNVHITLVQAHLSPDLLH